MRPWHLDHEAGGTPPEDVGDDGQHGALAPLLDRGFAITDVDTACASEDGLLADPTRHTMHGEARVATGASPRRSGSATAG